MGELQHRMSYAEWVRWLLYRKVHGPMSDDRRYDRPAAQVAQVVMATRGKASRIADFMPFTDEPETTIDDIARELGAFARSR